MLTDVKTSPAKGKAREDIRWQSNWWDFLPLVEHIQRPVAWTTSSIIFVAHSTQPLVVARLFPSPKQFSIPSPAPVHTSTASYEPPTVISVSPNDHWLFAYFPGRERDGVGCLWQRGFHIDNWTVKEWWGFPRGAGVIAAAWAGAEREWVTCPDGSTSRLPPRGPLTPVSDPTLLLVTQSHQLNVCYLRTYLPTLRFMTCSLIQPHFTSENPAHTPQEMPGGAKTARLCIRASIGFMHSDSSVLIAMRSQRYPSDAMKHATDLSLEPSDLKMPTPVPPPDEGPAMIDWETWGEESTIDLCEVKLKFDAIQMLMNLISNPLPPLHCPPEKLTNLLFVSTPPFRSDPSSPRKDKTSLRNHPPELASTYLVATFLDFGDYSAPPKSEVTVFMVARNPPPTSIGKAWITRQVASRSFSPRVLTFIAACLTPSISRKPSVIAALVDTAGVISRNARHSKDITVGKIVVLQLSDLSPDPDWEDSTLVSPAESAGTEWPVSISLSVNRALVCTASATKTTIQVLPRLRSVTDSKDFVQRSPLVAPLVTALLSRKSIADVSHALSLRSSSNDLLVETLRGAISALEINAKISSSIASRMPEALAAVIEIYRAKVQESESDDDRGHLIALWQNAHDMCSITACAAAFEECRDGDSYDLDAVWQLVCLSGWIVNFLEHLLKECVALADISDTEPDTKIEPADHQDIFSWDSSARAAYLPSFDTPILLHLVHPFARANLCDIVSHVNRFHSTLSSLTAKGESSHIARDVLLDLVSCSGVNLGALESTLKDEVCELTSIPADDVRLALARSHPVPSMYAQLRKVIQKIASSSAVDKPRLFLKPSDLVDGFANLSTSEQPGKEQERDVVTKGFLLKRGPGLTCVRCGYRSEIGSEAGMGGHTSIKWRSWEKKWAAHCICGGSWIQRK
ncbi:hypothetical protein BJ138DRAFT_1145401 [Hygrophoropsis aurantiaca]|uniref:Uncharacterized protein n=1 Tax=Hygrophoropsis aurantiaca TaxID=72124 RepID=A0ACB8AKG0_9AGAM|nr:hypothetical protein BJ138DRAFT_1145401 [Hygrophoropsis aurantiaca]